MKTAMLMTLMLTALGSHAYAQGGREGGNGGNGRVCFANNTIKAQVQKIIVENNRNGTRNDPLEHVLDHQITDVQLLDFYAARQPALDGTIDPLIVAKPGEDFLAILNDRVKLVKKVHHLYSEQIARSRSLLPLNDNHRWKGSVDGLRELNDHRFVENLSGPCLLMQIAVQVPLSDETFVVNYDTRLFKKMGEIDKAGLVWHEWNYNFLIRALRDVTSQKTQFILPYVFSQNFKLETAPAFAAMIQGLGAFPEMAIYCSAGLCIFRDKKRPSSLSYFLQDVDLPVLKAGAGTPFWANTTIRLDPPVRYLNLDWKQITFSGALTALIESGVVTGIEGIPANELTVRDVYQEVQQINGFTNADWMLSTLQIAQGAQIELRREKDRAVYRSIRVVGRIHETTLGLDCTEVTAQIDSNRLQNFTCTNLNFNRTFHGLLFNSVVGFRLTAEGELDWAVSYSSMIQGLPVIHEHVDYGSKIKLNRESGVYWIEQVANWEMKLREAACNSRPITFYRNEGLKSCYARDKAIIQGQKINPQDFIEFDESGVLIRVTPQTGSYSMSVAQLDPRRN